MLCYIFLTRNICDLCIMMFYVGFLLLSSFTSLRAIQITAVKYDLGGAPPNLTGPLEPNFLLSAAERYKVGELKGPESFAFYKGHIFTGLSDGRIVDISDCGIRTVAKLGPAFCGSESQCGRPLGLRIDRLGRLVVADSARGIFRIDLRNYVNGFNGRVFVETLYNSNVPVNGKKCKFINDLVVAKDGTILFTDSSAKWTRKEFLYVVLEGETTGRLLAYNDKTRQVITVLDKLAFPNGIEFGPNEESLLIAETSRARIRKLSLKHGRTWLNLSTFAANLPGLPDNIRASGRGTYWVAMSQARHANVSSPVDDYADNPSMRETAASNFNLEQLMAMTDKYGLVVELDETGRIIRSLQDPTGQNVAAVSEAAEKDGFLYLGSFDQPHVSRVPLSDKFDVDRFIAKVKSTCRATRMNIAKVRVVLKRLVAIAELRKFLISTRKRVDEERMKQRTTTPASFTSTAYPNTTSSGNTTQPSVSDEAFTNSTSSFTTLSVNASFTEFNATGPTTSAPSSNITTTLSVSRVESDNTTTSASVSVSTETVQVNATLVTIATSGAANETTAVTTARSNETTSPAE